MYYFMADPHFGHTNVLKYDGRPFDDIKDHDQTIISNVNKVVRPKDTLVLIGDFCWSQGGSKVKYDIAKGYRDQIKCEHIWFIWGNHDNKVIAPLFQVTEHLGRVRYAKEHIVVCHYAMTVWNRSHYGSWHLHGHSHGRLDEWKEEYMPEARSLDVGVNMHDYKPLSFDQVHEYMTKRPGHILCHRKKLDADRQTS